MTSIKPLIDLVTDNKDLIKNVGEAAINTYQVGKNTKQIVDSIRNKDKNLQRDLTLGEKLAYDNKNKLENVINRINKIKSGSGFAIV